MTKRAVLIIMTLALVAAACGDDDSGTDTDAAAATTTTEAAADDDGAETDAAAADDGAETDDTPAGADDTDDEALSATDADTDEPAGETVTVLAEVWADNWFSLNVNGEFVGEDSVPITTERSFNAETFTFEATLPMTIAIEAKDFKETDSGIEYIGEPNQQMGDGGIIAQFTNAATGEVIAVTDGTWTILPVHQAPLDKGCESAADPDTECEWLIIDTPADWTAVDFDDTAWASATEWTEADVSPKDGYDQIGWVVDAALIWGTDLEIDNTVLLRPGGGSPALDRGGALNPPPALGSNPVTHVSECRFAQSFTAYRPAGRLG
ncbi:MAG: PEBP family protein [Actinomycetota bacterium]